MKVSVMINVEFEESDKEECGRFRKVETEFAGDWGAVSDAVGQALNMLHLPRPILVVAKLIEELGIEPGETHSGQFASCAERVIAAFDRVDGLISKNAKMEDVLSEMTLI
jgi:hypothetical protein